jgi:hypothetical protein
MTNSLGLLICIALILASTNFDLINNLLIPKDRIKKTQKPSQTNAVKLPERQNETPPKSSYTNKINQSTQQNTPLQTTNQPAMQPQINEHPQFETLEQIPKKTKPLNQKQTIAEKDCPYCFGYLHQKVKPKELPDRCLICKNLIDCSSKTDQTQ